MFSSIQSGNTSWKALNVVSAQLFWEKFGINYFETQDLDPVLARELLQACDCTNRVDQYNAAQRHAKAAAEAKHRRI